MRATMGPDASGIGRHVEDRRISIVVPCYNRAAYLGVLLRSLTWSAVPASDFEVIVVNDGGTDHVDLVVDEWRRHGLDVRLLALRSGGAPRNNARARNTGLREARYPIVVQTDPDIVFVSDVLAAVRNRLRPGTFGSCAGYYPLTREATLEVAFGAAGPADAPEAYRARARQRPNQVLAPDGVGGLHGAFACARADLLRAGGYDESFEYWGWEDRELIVTLGHLGLTREVFDGVDVVHLWHAPRRGVLGREALAERGLVSRAAFDLQMQRAAAEFPRPLRPAPQPRIDRTTDAAAPFTREDYERWRDDRATAAQAAVLDRMFLDAHRFEAAEQLAAGQASLAREILHDALRQPWRRATSGRADVTALAHVDRAGIYAMLARTSEVLHDRDAWTRDLDALRACDGGAVLAAETIAQAALRRGDLERARAAAGDLRGSRWTAGRVSLAIEIAARDGRTGAVLDLLHHWVADGADGDYFERLRLAAYATWAGASPAAEPRVAGQPADALADVLRAPASERSEFLYSAAVRSMRLGLDLAAVFLFERFLAVRPPAEARLAIDAEVHREAALARLSRRAGVQIRDRAPVTSDCDARPA